MQCLSERKSPENRYLTAMYSNPFTWQVLFAVSLFLALWGCIFPTSLNMVLEAPIKEFTLMVPEQDEREGSEPGEVVPSHCGEQRDEEMNLGTGPLVT